MHTYAHIFTDVTTKPEYRQIDLRFYVNSYSSIRRTTHVRGFRADRTIIRLMGEYCRSSNVLFLDPLHLLATGSQPLLAPLSQTVIAANQNQLTERGIVTTEPSINEYHRHQYD